MENNKSIKKLKNISKIFVNLLTINLYKFIIKNKKINY